MPRQARETSSTGIYHVVVRGVGQHQIFYEEQDYAKLLEVLKICKEISGFQLLAYCLMGNHFHLLVKEGNEPIALIMKRVLNRFVYWYNLKYKRAGHLFQDRYKSEPIESDEYVFGVIRYIHQNPVKTNIVKDYGRYKFSSYNDYIKGGGITDRLYIMNMLSLDEFKRYHKEGEKISFIDAKDKTIKLLTDEEAIEIIYKYSNCKSADEFQNLPEDYKQKHIKRLKEKGLSIRQISRLTGTSKGIVEKYLKTQNRPLS